MNLEELYEKMKDALRFFGLSFHDKAKVSVWTDRYGNLNFTYEGATIKITVP